ncbi:MAG: AmmeMemoRadiSam system radical SAM enzyme [Spirochaetota bacterium]|jgi:pyruvate formate lyase activating enzyme|nr:AmmeMemoRadiSam system radical SAM enzyme [Spirochaetota bacterium]
MSAEKEARWWTPLTDGKTSCRLCPRGCVLSGGALGVCGARKNTGGIVYSLGYGRPAAIALDPIEKKPLYHFYPGTLTYSLGGLGCNMRCLHCQNASLSCALEKDFDGLEICAPDSIPENALQSGCASISWTYNEPLVWSEFVIESMRAAKARGIPSALVTAGLAHPEVWQEFLPVMDACSLDIKGWGDAFYTRLTGFPGFAYVLQNARAAYQAGCHLEIVTNLMCGWNDDDASLAALAEWIARLSPDIPWHITASRPAHRLMQLKPTPESDILRAVAIGKNAGLSFVYGGNVANLEIQKTCCPHCAMELILRSPFALRRKILAAEAQCPNCGTRIYGRF